MNTSKIRHSYKAIFMNRNYFIITIKWIPCSVLTVCIHSSWSPSQNIQQNLKLLHLTLWRNFHSIQLNNITYITVNTKLQGNILQNMFWEYNETNPNQMLITVCCTKLH
jgi:hypothetical protein